METLNGFKLHNRRTEASEYNPATNFRSWRNGKNTFCAATIARLFGKLDKKASYDVRFYSKKPRTKVVELYIRRGYYNRFYISKGSGMRHPVNRIQFTKIWEMGKHTENSRARIVYARVVKV